MKNYILFIVISLFYSCDSNKVVEKYSNGDVKFIYKLVNGKKEGLAKEFYRNGNKKSEVLFSNGLEDGEAKYYYKTHKDTLNYITLWKEGEPFYRKTYLLNGRLKSKGPLTNNGLKSGKWEFYNKNGIKKEILEFIELNGESYLNQKWMLNERGDTLSAKGNYYKSRMKDTASVKKPFRIYFFLKEPLFSYDDSDLSILIPQRGENLADDFSNEKNIEWDTIQNLAQRFKDKGAYSDRNLDVLLDLQYSSPGQKKIKGILIEKYNIPEDSSNYDFKTRKIYFNKEIYIKE